MALTGGLGGVGLRKGQRGTIGPGGVRLVWGDQAPASLFATPDITDEIIRQVANQERMRNQLGRTRASTFFGGQFGGAFAQPAMNRKRLFGGFNGGTPTGFISAPSGVSLKGR